MKEYQGRYSLHNICHVLKDSRSGYYAWESRRPSKRQGMNEEFLESIREVCKKSRTTCGSPRITDELNEQGIRCGKNRVARIMRGNGIWSYTRKRFRRTTQSRHTYNNYAECLIFHLLISLSISTAKMTVVDTAIISIHSGIAMGTVLNIHWNAGT